MNKTVSILTDIQKRMVYYYYKQKWTLKDIASIMNVSQRTVGRVLAQAGFLTPVPRLQNEAQKVMTLLGEYGLSYQGLKKHLEHTLEIRK